MSGMQGHGVCIIGLKAVVLHELQDIVVGKPRDADDRLDWLIQHHRFEQALHVLEADGSLSAASHAKVKACLIIVGCYR